MADAWAIRPMDDTDVGPAAAMILAGGWGDRTVFLEWAVGHASCRAFLAEIDGRIVGTGVATANGSVGWVGTIFVAPDERGRGIGAALTRAVVYDLERRDCRTLVLIATDEGRPVYERQGFTVQTRYVRYAAPSGPPPVADDLVRELRASDLPVIVELDRIATGEDRSAILRSFAELETGRIAQRPDGRVGGFLVRSPWGGKALIAPDPDDALRLLDWRRSRAAPDRRIGIAVLEENQTGRGRLAEAGWEEQPGGTRMIRGEPLAWRPEMIWGQFNGALG
ncbi:MAG TPA: GNAT family N-acetyltransferase [Candidatus Limnocylindrales bacterium]|nr:GNAT family N-acetyltransferase [Candidatus Limnocylindrales bacterium]